ncbi:MAG: TIGR04076 family protein [Acholeplasmatales bacterium]|nr:TIGR04076 family protein [Acholeplasmatales bacterium]
MIKITVMKIACYKDLIDKYENPILHACDMKLGQVFMLEELKKPNDMCDSAWGTIYPFVRDLFDGKEDFFDGWMKNKKSAMISCNDGFRPVSFYIEVV